MASGSQTITPKQLVILQYLARRVSPQKPEGWTAIERMEHEIRFGHVYPSAPRQPITEELFGTHDGIFPLTGQRNEREDPYVLVHTGGKHYRISRNGIQMVNRCAIAKKKHPNGETYLLVIDKATNQPPLIETSDVSPEVEEYSPMEEDDAPQEPVVDLDAQPESVAPAEIDESDQDPPEPVRDEINNPLPIEALGKPGMNLRTTEPKKPLNRPPHRKAVVPGKG